jgi:alkylated DNA repair protein (DNA oxidative demethylase)
LRTSTETQCLRTETDPQIRDLPRGRLRKSLHEPALVNRQSHGGVNGDLFGLPATPAVEALDAGAMILRAFASDVEASLLAAVAQLIVVSPLRQMTTPGGYRMSVAMTNTGAVGWVTDPRGYRYDPIDPLTQAPWPAMPESFQALAQRAALRAGFAGFEPDACLVNRYEPGARLSLHRDYDERDATAPIVSVSLGVPAKFLWGGLKRTDPIRRLPLQSGDVAVWGAQSRFVYHGIAPLQPDRHPLTGQDRINLTFRKAR